MYNVTVQAHDTPEIELYTTNSDGQTVNYDVLAHNFLESDYTVFTTRSGEVVILSKLFRSQRLWRIRVYHEADPS